MIVGKYKPQALARYSPAFYRWWIVDRLVENWEGWAGMWFLETWFLNSFYQGMGMDLDISANVASFIREFDLVKIGADGDITGELVPRIVTCDGVIMHRISIG